MPASPGKSDEKGKVSIRPHTSAAGTLVPQAPQGAGKHKDQEWHKSRSRLRHRSRSSTEKVDQKHRKVI